MNLQQRDERFMRSALLEARKGLGHTSPNPAVGAVLVAGSKIVARGHHARAGGVHAEIACLRAFGRAIPPAATLHVTLEPCSSAGKTASCAHALIAAGVKNAVVGAIDPNPRHSGRGIELMRAAGIRVRTGVLENECTALNEAFNKWITTGQPFVVAKCGMSLDGRLTRRPGEVQWITGPAARRHARMLRAQVDAVLVGASTIRADNPRLTARGVRGARQPWRIVLTRGGRLPQKARIFNDRFAARTRVIGKGTLRKVFAELGRNEITSVLIEGGGDVLSQALDARLIDKVQIYLGPLLTGGPVLAFGGRGAGGTSEAAFLRGVSYERIGQDVCVSGYPNYPA
ncbi:MAG TPA: bifunctional diaminohydroxyphosphoribosylaminopyrimidine deaminase/5-amino-6-(5-phosphoribosylamino)uracil reductase RibD [Chthoniobacterales bacterium]|nr:bifunctional diaminohydroxyphosphoribosylaminopyrimidine deaminase/5-amino-6-(5-phosphoribosylamino)uracil reductase RibD [Chthoniobacterales bacterium]